MGEMNRNLWVRDCRRDYKRCELIEHEKDVYLYMLEIGDGRVIWQVWLGDTRLHASDDMQEAYRRFQRASGKHYVEYHGEA